MTGSPLPSRGRKGLLLTLRALLAEGGAHRLDTAPDPIVNAPWPAGSRGRSSAVREMLRPKGRGHGHGLRQRSLTGAGIPLAALLGVVAILTRRGPHQ